MYLKYLNFRICLSLLGLSVDHNDYITEIVNEWFSDKKFTTFNTPFITDSAYQEDIMASLRLTGNSLHKSEIEYHGKFGNIIGRIQHTPIMSKIYICYTACVLVTQTVVPNIPCFKYLNLCIQYMVSHPHKTVFILLIPMMAQMSSYLHGVGSKLKTKQPRIVKNVIKSRIVLYLLTEEVKSQVLLMLVLTLQSTGDYIFNQLYHMTALVDKLNACTRM